MDSDRHIWQVWATNLHRWGVGNWVASILEAVGPMTLLGAQAVYVGQPVLKVAIPQGHLDALVNLLEDPTQTRAFITYLREETAS